MPTPRRALRVCLFLLACPAAATAQDVLATQSADGRVQAWLNPRDGLVITGWSAMPRGTLVLGNVADARFDDRGDLYFVRTRDRDHEEVDRTWFVLEQGRDTPRATDPHHVPAPAPWPRQASVPTKVCLDPGHGGTDPGAVGNGLQEKDITLDVILRLRAWLDLDTQDPAGGGEWNVLLTRDTDRDVSLQQRTDMANLFGAETFLSVHMNAFSSASANGTETYCWTGLSGTTSGQLRNRVHAEALAAWSLTNRGTKEANFFVLRNTNMPATLLEGGFITNQTDAAVMAQAAQRDQLARRLMYALQEHHGFARYDPQPGNGAGLLRGVLYDASVGPTARLTNQLVSLADGTFAHTSSTGYFEFALSAGTYAYAATAAGFAPGELARQVPANGEVWGSLGLMPDADVRPLVASPINPTTGGLLTFTASGDPGTPVVLFSALRPFLPLTTLPGVGTLWPDPTTVFALPLGTANALGTARLDVRVPLATGLILHAQAISFHGVDLRVSNGIALAFL